LYQHAAASSRRRPPSSAVLLLRTRGGGAASSTPPPSPSTLETTSTALNAVAVPLQNNTTEATTTNNALSTETSTSILPTTTLVQQQLSSWLNQMDQEAVAGRLQKCAAVLGATVATFLLKQQGGGLSAVAASSWVGIASALTTHAPAAAFCGSFAGMSAQVATVRQAVALGSCAAAVFYWWDAKAMGVGKGGRLGTMAFLGNLLYAGRGIVPLIGETLQTLSPITAVVMAMATSTLRMARTQEVAQVPINDCDDDNDDAVVASPTQDPTNQRRLAAASKAVVLAAAAVRLFTSTSVSVGTVLQSLVSMVAAAVAVQKSSGVVLPVATVGLLGSFYAPLAAPIYLGAFVGMTGLTDFKLGNIVQACSLATLLLHLGVLDGFGGKLGFLSFLGVLFGM